MIKTIFLTYFIQYMVILFMLFLIQFSVACACLAVNPDQQEKLAQQVWIFFSTLYWTKVITSLMTFGILSDSSENYQGFLISLFKVVLCCCLLCGVINFFEYVLEHGGKCISRELLYHCIEIVWMTHNIVVSHLSFIENFDSTSFP